MQKGEGCLEQIILDGILLEGSRVYSEQKNSDKCV